MKGWRQCSPFPKWHNPNSGDKLGKYITPSNIASKRSANMNSSLYIIIYLFNSSLYIIIYLFSIRCCLAETLKEFSNPTRILSHKSDSSGGIILSYVKWNHIKLSWSPNSLSTELVKQYCNGHSIWSLPIPPIFLVCLQCSSIHIPETSNIWLLIF